MDTMLILFIEKLKNAVMTVEPVELEKISVLHATPVDSYPDINVLKNVKMENLVTKKPTNVPNAVANVLPVGEAPVTNAPPVKRKSN